MSKEHSRREVLSGAAAVVAASALPAMPAAKGIHLIPPKLRRYLEARAAPMPLEQWLERMHAADGWVD